VNDDRRDIGIRELAGVFWRSFLLQASWSFERMQSLGFAFAMLPVLRRLYPDRAERASRVKEHLEYFNTQPYLASFILGAAARKEQERAAGRGPSADVPGTKTALAAPLGALGDSFFWGGVKPLAASLAVAFLMPGSWWAPLFFLAFYNVWHMGARADLLWLGFRSGGDEAAFMNRFDIPKMTQVIKTMTLAVIGCLIGIAPAWTPQFHLPGLFPGPVQAAIALLVTVVLVALLRRGASPIKLMLVLATVSLILVFLGVNP
jgi:PTS system mannose-specific IID component